MIQHVVIEVPKDASGHRQEWKLLSDPSTFLHKSTLGGLKSILSAQQIVPNMGQFAPQFGQSDISYSRWLGGVSLLDLTTETDERIQEHVDKYTLFGSGPARPFIKIRRAVLDRTRVLLPPDLTAKTDPRLRQMRRAVLRMCMYVPAVEAIHIGPIATSSVVGYVLAGRITDGQLLFREFGSGETDELFKCAESWDAANSRGGTPPNLIGVSSTRRQRSPEEIEDILRRFEEQYGVQ